MYPFAKVLVLFYGLYDVRVKVPWERGRKLYARHPRGRDVPQKPRERGCAFEPFEARLRLRAVAVDVLPYELHLPVTLPEELPNLFDYRGSRATTLAPARVRHDAVRAELIAPLYYGDERR